MGLNAVYYDLENWKGILASDPKKGKSKLTKGRYSAKARISAFLPTTFCLRCHSDRYN